jgi:hypothetical protein
MAHVRLASPGARHRALEPMIGTFEVFAKTWADADSPAEEAHGTIENRWILGGRFVHGELKVALRGMPFEGVQTLGFDNAKQRYVATWIDNMGTDISPVLEGTADAGGKVITLKGTANDPLKHATMRVREVWTIESDDRHELEMWSSSKDGAETKVLEIVCTRK